MQAAWRTLRARGLQSLSKRTRDEVLQFDQGAFRELRRIADQLRTGQFEFTAQQGILIRRPAKRLRPLVIAGVRNRIVQRAILDVLQADPRIKNILEVATSFGGIEGRSREGAIHAVREAIVGGARHFIKSDIKDSFTKIPRDQVMDLIRKGISDIDQQFLDVLHAAMATNLVNVEELGVYGELFPVGDVGVAQGSPLSAMMGNILLKDFDAALNGRGVSCIRFIDDFILLGANPSYLMKAFFNAQKMLGEFSMEAYDPASSSEKAVSGETDKGFDFLGCHISRGWVQPSTRSRKQLVESVKETLRDSLKELRTIAYGHPHRWSNRAFSQTLSELHHRIVGWGDAYDFCNCRKTFEALDRDITSLIRQFHESSLRLQFGQPPHILRQILGVGLLAERRSGRRNAA